MAQQIKEYDIDEPATSIREYEIEETPIEEVKPSKPKFAPGGLTGLARSSYERSYRSKYGEPEEEILTQPKERVDTNVFTVKPKQAETFWGGFLNSLAEQAGELFGAPEAVIGGGGLLRGSLRRVGRSAATGEIPSLAKQPEIKVSTKLPDKPKLKAEEVKANLQQFGQVIPSSQQRLEQLATKGILSPDEIAESRLLTQPIGDEMQNINRQIIENNRKAPLVRMAREPEKKGLIREALDFNRSLLTAFDLSAPGRQGKALLMTKPFWTSLDDMVKSWGSKNAFETVMKSIEDMPEFMRGSRLVGGVARETKSLADRAGLDVTDILTRNEEMFRSKYADIIPGVARSNRAYVAYLNKLRADTFSKMIKSYQKEGLDPTGNDVLLQKIGSFINDATGRGRLPKIGNLDLERSAKGLSDVFFAPRLMASRINMYKRFLNPKTYSGSDPVMRKEALKSLFSVTGFGTMLGEMARLGGAEVSNDPSSSDFRKIKIGDTRIDPFGGFQQYAVGASRLASGTYTSTISGKQYDLSTGKFGQPSRASVTESFFANKLAPVPSFIWSWMTGREFDGEPFEVKRALLNRTVPIAMQDLYDLYQEDPELLPLGILPVIGEGLQSYGR